MFLTAFGKIFTVVNGPRLKKSSHLVTLRLLLLLQHNLQWKAKRSKRFTMDGRRLKGLISPL